MKDDRFSWLRRRPVTPPPDPGRNGGVFNLKPCEDGHVTLSDRGEPLSKALVEIQHHDPRIAAMLRREGEDIDFKLPQRRELKDAPESNVVYAWGRPGGPIADPERRARGLRNRERDLAAGRISVEVEPSIFSRIITAVKRRFRWGS